MIKEIELLKETEAKADEKIENAKKEAESIIVKAKEKGENNLKKLIRSKK